MMLEALHTTIYSYSEPVSLCYTEVRLKPRDRHGQRLVDHHLVVEPEPSSITTRRDFFGNDVSTLTIDEPHTVLHIAAASMVEMSGATVTDPPLTLPWERVRDTVRECRTDEAFAAFQFTLDSPRVPLDKSFAQYAASSFKPNRLILECAIDLCERIFKDFQYDREATTVTTTTGQTLRNRRGVCQDFAHVMIASLRVLGLPARYVSGYLRTGESAIGAHASHAWVAVYCGGSDWLELDPTNNMRPSTDHVTLGWGRDYSDVPPVKGVALGGGQQLISVEVRVAPPRPGATD
jgi:transglutaminase-like putative cysteine protease